MRRLAFALTLLALTLPSPRGEARQYTLKDLLDKVSRDYAGVDAAREGEAMAQARLHQANRLWAPTGQIAFGITGSPDIKCVGPANPDGSLPSIDSNKLRREENCVNTSSVDLEHANVASVLPVHGVAFNINMNVIQPLYTFGKIEAAKEAAHAGIDLAQHQTEAARNEARLLAVRAYFGLKWARASKATIDDGLSQLKSWVKKIDAEIDKGKSTYTISDVIRLKIALDNAKLVALDVARGLDLALAGLRTLTKDPEADVDDAELDETELIDESLSYYEDAALLHRPEARMLDAGMGLARANRKYKLANMMPNLGLNLSLTYGIATGVDTPLNGFMNRPNIAGGSLLLAGQIPIDFAVKLGQYEEAKAQERQAIARREQALNGLGIEVRKAYDDFIEARERSRVLAHEEKITRGWFNATDQALNTGVADARDLSESAQNYFQFRLRHLQAIMDQNINLSVLRNTAGLLGSDR